MTGAEVFVVSGEPLWPANHGGRIRTASIAAEIGRRLPMRLVAPVEGEPEADVPFDPLPPMMSHRRLATATSSRPRLGRELLDARRREVLLRLISIHRPLAVLFAQSYLGAMISEPETRTVVDFSDVEVRRSASLARHGSVRARLAYSLESLKARVWEPVTARRSVFCSTPSESDAALLRSWGATAVVVPHGAEATGTCPSPDDGPVTYIASFGYAPNRQAAAFVMQQVWPQLHRAEPSLRLRLVGRHASRFAGGEAEKAGIEVVSDPQSTEPYYREASVILAPVQAGGGTQLKVSEALARGRVIVATPFSAASAPENAGLGVVVAEGAEQFATSIRSLWRNLDERRSREGALVERRVVPTWQETCRPLVDALEREIATPRRFRT